MSKAPRKLKLLIAYDGTRFAGWQRQKGHRTVQETVENVLKQILGEKAAVTAAGRTDSGVHAEGQVAHVALRSPMPLPVLHRAMNALLPEDILIRSVVQAPKGFHARYSAKQKHYRYSIWNSPWRPLEGRGRLVHVKEPLDLSRMRRLAKKLQGKRDFRAFHSSGRQVASTVRHLRSLTVTRQGSKVLIDAKADGFLYHMVRRIAGLLIEEGKGKPPPAVAPTAPAKGLCLLEVRYG